MPSGLVAELTAGDRTSGFRVLRVAAVPALHFTFFELVHERLGSRLVHLASADDNNCFMVALRTIPADSTGVAHILEHSVLEGSQRYPVQTFKHMNGRSLHSFLNAMTAADHTGYPFATRNGRDFHNLLDLFCDAVFFPLLEPETFLQEAWRLEPADPAVPGGPLAYRGVVYNEMRGALSHPVRQLRERTKQALFPDLTYRFISGGDPEVMPRLTYEDWRAFHARHYHPSNAFFFTYGSFPLSETLAHLEERFLSRFERAEPVPPPPLQTPFEGARRLRFTFPVGREERVAGRSVATVNWRLAPAADTFAGLELRLLEQLLSGNLSAPLVRALLQAGLGGGPAPAGLDGGMSEAIYGIGLKDIDESAADRVEAVVLETLAGIARDGLEADELEAALHQLEFQELAISGGGYPYGLVLAERGLPAWLNEGDFLAGVDTAGPIAALRQAAARPGYAAGLVRRWLIENPNRATLVITPEPGGLERQEAAVRDRLEGLRAEMSAEDGRRLIDQGRLLAEFQAREENLDCLPSVARADLARSEQADPQEQTVLAGRPAYRHGLPTNGVGYLGLVFDAGPPEPGQAAYLPLAGLLAEVGAGGRGHAATARLVHRVTGGVSVSASAIQVLGEDLPRLVWRAASGAFRRHHEDMAGVLAEVLTRPDLHDRQRLQELIGSMQAYALPSVVSRAPTLLALAAGRGLSPVAALEHEMEGLVFTRRLLAFRPAALEEWAEGLAAALAGMLQRSRLVVSLTAEPGDMESLAAAAAEAAGRLPAGLATSGSPFFSSPNDDMTRTSPVREAWLVSTPVSYVCRVLPGAAYEHPDGPVLRVLAQLMEEPLYSRVRARGGAYGCWARVDHDSRTYQFFSYRDPHTAETLRAFDEVIADLGAGRYSDRHFDEAVIETVRMMDQPLTPRSRGDRAFLRALCGLTQEVRQRYRDAVLDVTRAEIERVIGRYLARPEREGIAVLTSREILAGPEAAALDLAARPVEPAAAAPATEVMP